MKNSVISLNNISLEAVLRELRMNWVAIVCFALATFFGATGIGRLTYRAEYTASATLVIRVQGSDIYSSLANASQMASVYSRVFQSEALRNVISENIGEPVVGDISCQQISGTNLLMLSATSPTPRQAYLFIYSALDTYEEVVDYVFGNAALEIVQEPAVPEEPSNASLLVDNRVILSLIGALAAIGFILLLYIIRNTVKVSTQASELLDGSILGTIPHEKKQIGKQKVKNSSLLITSPLTSSLYSENIRRIASKIENRMRRKGQKIALILSVVENEGKSTTAANLAISLAERGRRVLLVDGDLRKPAQWKIFDLEKREGISLSDVLDGHCAWEQAVMKNERGDFLQLLQFDQAKDPARLLNGEELTHFLTQAAQKMDIILIDCCPVAAVADAEIWMHHVDTVVMVVRQDCADVRVINDTVDLIWKSTQDFSGFILNDFWEDKFSLNKKGYYENYER